MTGAGSAGAGAAAHVPTHLSSLFMIAPPPLREADQGAHPAPCFSRSAIGSEHDGLAQAVEFPICQGKNREFGDFSPIKPAFQGCPSQSFSRFTRGNSLS